MCLFPPSNKYLLFLIHNKRTLLSSLPEKADSFCKEQKWAFINSLFADFATTSLWHLQGYVCWAELRMVVKRNLCLDISAVPEHNRASIDRIPSWMMEDTIQENATAVSFDGPCRAWSTEVPLGAFYLCKGTDSWYKLKTFFIFSNLFGTLITNEVGKWAQTWI